MTDQLKGAASTLQNTASSGVEKAQKTVQNPTSATSEEGQHWEAMSEEQKQQAFESLPSEKKQGLVCKVYGEHSVSLLIVR